VLFDGMAAEAKRKRGRHSRGTTGSNPLSSSAESAANFVFGREASLWVKMSSRPEDSHLRALPDPYVNLSIHTAPDVRPFPWQSCQWAKSAGFARRSRSNQSRAPLVLRRNRLNLVSVHTRGGVFGSIRSVGAAA
jgi:hypothetical protein